MDWRKIGYWLFASTLWLGSGCDEDDARDLVILDSGRNYTTATDAAKADSEVTGAASDAGQQNTLSDADLTDAAAPEGDAADSDAEVVADGGAALDGGSTPDSGDADAAQVTPDNDAQVDAGSQMDGATGEDDASETDAGEQPDAAPQGPIDIAGSWHSSFGGMEVIASATWTTPFDTITVVEYDNATNTVILQNPDSAMYNAGKFSKVVWSDPQGDTFYYCTLVFGLDSAQAARDDGAHADASDPAHSGCGDFAWTRLDAPIEITGTYSNGSPFTISSDNWADMAMRSYDNATNTAIVQNTSEDVAPLKFNKVVWLERSGATLDVCWIAENVDTAQQAQAAEGVVDTNDLDTGCKGGAWTHYDAP
jgi:hypothetical protein